MGRPDPDDLSCAFSHMLRHKPCLFELLVEDVAKLLDGRILLGAFSP